MHAVQWRLTLELSGAVMAADGAKPTPGVRLNESYAPGGWGAGGWACQVFDPHRLPVTLFAVTGDCSVSRVRAEAEEIGARRLGCGRDADSVACGRPRNLQIDAMELASLEPEPDLWWRITRL